MIRLIIGRIDSTEEIDLDFIGLECIWNRLFQVCFIFFIRYKFMIKSHNSLIIYRCELIYLAIFPLDEVSLGEREEIPVLICGVLGIVISIGPWSCTIVDMLVSSSLALVCL